MIIKLKENRKFKLTMIINFISSKDSDESRTMHTKSKSTEIMMGNETDEVIEELIESLLQKYQEVLEEQMRGSEFNFDIIGFLHCNLNKISLNRGGSYIDSLKQLKNKKITINSKNNDDKCFQHAITAALNYEQFKKDLQRK